jgi:excisionase family DNA binding protein
MSPPRSLSTVPRRRAHAPSAGSRERLVALRKQLRVRASGGRQLTPDRSLVDAQQLAEVLGVPHTWILRKARAGEIPHHKLGHYVRFDIDEIIAWLDETKVEPVARRRR